MLGVNSFGELFVQLAAAREVCPSNDYFFCGFASWQLHTGTCGERDVQIHGPSLGARVALFDVPIQICG
ncbi:hypothetical protein ASH00_14290 [Arthrobacter sp. Soil782]|nr:hypothetical protein ASH00_14290 [Arthrobacter sp. Soil782]